VCITEDVEVGGGGWLARPYYVGDDGALVFRAAGGGEGSMSVEGIRGVHSVVVVAATSLREVRTVGEIVDGSVRG